jgi:hypothetical protein
MADTAAHLVERVLPEVPVRQWVLTLPYPLRYRCAWDKQLTSEVLRAFLRSIFADQRRRARRIHGIRKGQCGAVTFIQRFGSALNLTPHFHSLVLDGVYPGPAHSPGSFLPLPPPETEDVARVMAGTARRVMRLLERRGLENGDDMVVDDPLLATLMAASVRSRIATGSEAGKPWRRLGDRVEPVEPADDPEAPVTDAPPRCVREGGMSLHADVAVPARDRRRLERLQPDYEIFGTCTVAFRGDDHTRGSSVVRRGCGGAAEPRLSRGLCRTCQRRAAVRSGIMDLFGAACSLPALRRANDSNRTGERAGSCKMGRGQVG